MFDTIFGVILWLVCIAWLLTLSLVVWDIREKVLRWRATPAVARGGPDVPSGGPPKPQRLCVYVAGCVDAQVAGYGYCQPHLDKMRAEAAREEARLAAEKDRRNAQALQAAGVGLGQAVAGTEEDRPTEDELTKVVDVTPADRSHARLRGQSSTAGPRPLLASLRDLRTDPDQRATRPVRVRRGQ